MHKPEKQLQEAIIGCLLLWPEEIDTVAATIKADDFHNEKCRMTYEYLLSHDGGDLVTVSAALRGQVEASDLTEWIATEVTAAFLPRYCRELKEVSNKLRLFSLLGEVRNMAASETSQEMLDKLDAGVTALAGTQISEPSGSKEMIMDATRRLKARVANKGSIQGIPYGIEQLDAATCGMHQGELVVVAGRPSMGKSAFAGNILENVCRFGKAGILFSLEMDKGNCIDRMIASAGSIKYNHIRSGHMQDADWPRIAKASNDIMGYRLLMDDTPGIGLREIKSKCRKLKRGGLDVVVVDYLQLMGTNTAVSNRVQAIGEISRGLKQMARELECTVILLSQLNRSVDGRPDKRPTMSDLRDSGEIEQDADVILFPFRPAAYCPKCKDSIEDHEHIPADHKQIAEIIIEKQRNGERNISVPVTWFGEYQRFVA